MARKTSTTRTKIGKKATAKRGAAKAAKARNTAAKKSNARKAAKARKPAAKSTARKASKARQAVPKPKVLKPAEPRLSPAKPDVLKLPKSPKPAPESKVPEAAEPRPSAPMWKVIKPAKPEAKAPKATEPTQPEPEPRPDVPKAAKPRETAPTSEGVEAAKPRLLSGGNPQIAKAEGNAPVQAFIAAMPDWKRDIGRRLDALITRAVPSVRKAVKWNSPFYGMEGQGWFLNFHCFTNYVKVAFFRGASLDPTPPGHSTSKNVRYLDIRENDALDETQLTTWAKQAAALPGWKV